ncbi:MAG: hypothetical protein QXT69_05855 [Fervidicoccaceae archaeon]
MGFRQFLHAVESAFRSEGCFTGIKDNALLIKCRFEEGEAVMVLERDVEGYLRFSLLTDYSAEEIEGSVLEHNFALYGIKVMKDSEGFLALAVELPEECALSLGPKHFVKEAHRMIKALKAFLTR